MMTVLLNGRLCCTTCGLWCIDNDGDDDDDDDDDVHTKTDDCRGMVVIAFINYICPRRARDNDNSARLVV